jgi:ribosome biogenesis GTPase
LEAKPRGIFRHQHITPMVGDEVELSENEGDYTIETILPRKNSFVRPPVANVDVALIVFAYKTPKPNRLLLDTLLVAAELGGAEPVLCLTKTDLAKDAQRRELQAIYGTTGYPLLEIDNREARAPEALEALLADKTAFLAGPSGVGKSTLANRLCAHQTMATGGLSQKLGRGKHTTRHVELLDMDCGGALLDTPGFSSFDIASALPAEELRDYFPEFARGACRFASCTHRKEPGCAVQAQLASGEVHPSRYQSYLALYERIDAYQSWR